jgi:hypothetical protein
MTRPNRIAIALAATFLGAATAASAGLPDPRFSVIDPIGVGDNTGTAVGGAPAGYDVTIRDVNNNPVPNAVIVLDFTNSHVRAYSTQNAGTTLDATAHTLTRIAPTGATNFAVRSGGFDNTNVVHVFGNGELEGDVKWRSTDIDALDGRTGLTDFAYFASRFITLATAPEVNFDLSQSDVPGLGDFAIFSREYLSGVTDTYAW